MRGLPILIVVFLALGVVWYIHPFMDGATKNDTLTFSNTAQWDPYYLSIAEDTLRYPTQDFVSISLPPPPVNSSSTTQNELASLLADKKLRTPKELADIDAEVNPDTTYVAGHTLTEYMDDKKFPATAALFKDSFHDLTVLLMRQKMKFDRVRPAVLNPAIAPVIPVPGHPAYPSGHSTQAHFVAYVLGELMPEKKDELVARADSIAKNREIAGLHYPSDTQGGILLAQQFFASMMKDPTFTALLTKAKKEWATQQ